MGKFKQAYLIVNQATLEASRHLLARCCLQLGYLQEAEHALLLHAVLDKRGLPKNVPGGAEGYYLLGVISRREHRRESAVELFRKSLEVMFPIDESSILHLLDGSLSVELNGGSERNGSRC